MGKRMRSRLDVLSGQTGAIAVLGLAFFLFGLAGIFSVGNAKEAECGEIRLWLEEAFRLVRDGTIEPVWNLLWSRSCLLFPVLILGTTPLGVLGLPLYFGWLGFRLACPVGYLFRIYGLSALYPASALFGLTAVLWFPLLLWAGSRGMLSAGRRLKNAASDEIIGAGILSWRIVCCLLLCVCVLIEYFAAPALLRAAAQVIL